MTDDAPKSCCRPSTTMPPVATRFPVAEFDEGLRARFLDEESERRARSRDSLLAVLRGLVDEYSLGDVLSDLHQAWTLRVRQLPDQEQPKQTRTLLDQLGHVARLADRYGM